MQLCDDALRALEKSFPAPVKVELAFALADLWSRYDLNRALEITELAVKYANQIFNLDNRGTEIPSYLQAFFLNIGKLNFAPGIEPQSLSEIGIYEGIGRLALIHWARTEQMGETIQNIGLRLRFQLTLCKAVLTSAKVDKKIALANQD